MKLRGKHSRWNVYNIISKPEFVIVLQSLGLLCKFLQSHVFFLPLWFIVKSNLGCWGISYLFKNLLILIKVDERFSPVLNSLCHFYSLFSFFLCLLLFHGSDLLLEILSLLENDLNCLHVWLTQRVMSFQNFCKFIGRFVQGMLLEKAKINKSYSRGTNMTVTWMDEYRESFVIYHIIYVLCCDKDLV